MACKACAGKVAPDGISYDKGGLCVEVVAESWVHVGGDGYAFDTSRPEDGGTFCSWACVRDYAERLAPKKVKKPVMCLLVAAFDVDGIRTHEERFLLRPGPISYETEAIPDGARVTVRNAKGEG